MGGPQLLQNADQVLQDWLDNGFPQEGGQILQILERKDHTVHKGLPVSIPGGFDAAHQVLPDLQKQVKRRDQHTIDGVRANSACPGEQVGQDINGSGSNTAHNGGKRFRKRIDHTRGKRAAQIGEQWGKPLVPKSKRCLLNLRPDGAGRVPYLFPCGAPCGNAGGQQRLEGAPKVLQLVRDPAQRAGNMIKIIVCSAAAPCLGIQPLDLIKPGQAALGLVGLLGGGSGGAANGIDPLGGLLHAGDAFPGQERKQTKKAVDQRGEKVQQPDNRRGKRGSQPCGSSGCGTL